jgi:hypothetical protein
VAALCVGWEEDVGREACGFVFLAGIHKSVLIFLFLFVSRQKEKEINLSKIVMANIVAIVTTLH